MFSTLLLFFVFCSLHYLPMSINTPFYGCRRSSAEVAEGFDQQQRPFVQTHPAAAH